MPFAKLCNVTVAGCYQGKCINIYASVTFLTVQHILFDICLAYQYSLNFFTKFYVNCMVRNGKMYLEVSLARRQNFKLGKVFFHSCRA